MIGSSRRGHAEVAGYIINARCHVVTPPLCTLFRKEFEQHKRNTKHLYKLVVKLTGCTSVNPLPEMDSDVRLAEDLADYFLNKIVKIRDNLDQYGKFCGRKSRSC